MYLDCEDKSAQLQDMMEGLSFVEQAPCLDTVEGCLNFASNSDGEPHDGEGMGERPCTPPPLYPRDFWSPVSVSPGATSLPRLASLSLNFEFGFD